MDWDEVKNEFETTNISLADLAIKYNIKYPTIKSRKQRQKWTKKDASKNASLDASESPKDASKKKHGGQPGNKNAVGHGAPKGNQNSVGHRPSAPRGNQNALTHGLYAKYLPAETLEIAQRVVAISPLDILWGNITIQYAAIVRAQKIMEVESKEELIKHIKSDGINATTYEFQFAWDRQATFMVAQSKAMTTLNKLIKQYDELCKSELATEEQRLRIEKLKLDIAKQNTGNDSVQEDPFDGLTAEELQVMIDDD